MNYLEVQSDGFSVKASGEVAIGGLVAMFVILVVYRLIAGRKP